jgi:transposase
LKQCWVIAPEANAEFVAAMEEVLEVYQRPYDPNYPVVCLDESNKQQVKETRTPMAMEPGQPERFDYEYERNGVSNLFMVFEPLAARRQVTVTDHRTALDYAAQLKALVDVQYPHARKIVIVQDQLNTHRAASLYKAFAPAEARRVLDKLEFHFTPKHGSWLNMAEIELSVLARQCLARRIPDQESLRQEVNAWQQSRNIQHCTVDWQFTTADARIKLKRLYPSIQS